MKRYYTNKKKQSKSYGALMSNLYHWLNPEKSRYFKIAIRESRIDEIILDYDWGSCTSNRGGKKRIIAESYEEAQKYIEKMKKRRKSRGYFLIAPKIN